MYMYIPSQHTQCYLLNQDEVRENVIHMSYVCNVQPHVYIAQIRPTEGTATTHAHSHVRMSHFYASLVGLLPLATNAKLVSMV